jgi:hypothetical protein
MFEYEVQMINTDTTRGGTYVMSSKRIFARGIAEAEEKAAAAWRFEPNWPVTGWYVRALYLREVRL